MVFNKSLMIIVLIILVLLSVVSCSSDPPMRIVTEIHDTLGNNLDSMDFLPAKQGFTDGNLPSRIRVNIVGSKPDINTAKLIDSGFKIIEDFYLLRHLESTISHFEGDGYEQVFIDQANNDNEPSFYLLQKENKELTLYAGLIEVSSGEYIDSVYFFYF